MINKLKTYWQLLEGKRTYLLATTGTILNIIMIVYPHLLTQAQILKIDAVLIALGGAAIRSSINRV